MGFKSYWAEVSLRSHNINGRIILVLSSHETDIAALLYMH